MLHCIKQSSGGGDSLFLDGFYVSKNIFLQDARAFELLRSFNVPFVDIGSVGDYTFGCSHSIITYDFYTLILYFCFAAKLFGSDFLKYQPENLNGQPDLNTFIITIYTTIIFYTTLLNNGKAINVHCYKKKQRIM